jgi:hypothetical protein
MAYGTMSWAILWLPLVLYGIQKSFKRKTFWSLALISLGLAASFFSGHFQTSLYVLMGVSGFLIFKLIETRDLKNFGWGLLFIFLGIGLALIQILPTFELYQLSVRSTFWGIGEIIPWQYLPTLLAPDFYGNAVTRNDWYGHYAEWSGFTGVIPLILATFALVRRKHREVWLFGLLAVFSLLVSRPTPLIDLIERLKVPVLANSAAARINSLWSFSVAILAGFGLESLVKDLKAKKVTAAMITGAGFLLVAGGLWGFLIIKKPFEVDQNMIAQRNLILPTGLVAAFLGLVIGFSLIQKLLKKKKYWRQPVFGLVLTGLIFLTAFDTWRFAQKWLPFDSRQHVYPVVPVLKYLDQKPDSERVFGYFGMEMQNYCQVPGFNGYDPLYIQRYGELLTSAAHGQIGMPSTRGVGLGRRSQHTIDLLNLLNGRWVLHAVEDGRNPWAFNYWEYPEQFNLSYEDDKYQVYENLAVLPKAFMVYDYQIATEPQTIINKIYASDDLSEAVILEESPVLKPGQPGQNSVSITNYSPSKIELTVQTGQPGLLYLAENDYPGWQALVDDQPAKIYRANYSFRAIEIPEGDHQVKFVYSPQSFKMGLAFSVISLLLILFLSYQIARRKS